MLLLLSYRIMYHALAPNATTNFFVYHHGRKLQLFIIPYVCRIFMTLPRLCSHFLKSSFCRLIDAIYFLLSMLIISIWKREKSRRKWKIKANVRILDFQPCERRKRLVPSRQFNPTYAFIRLRFHWIELLSGYLCFSLVSYFPSWLQKGTEEEMWNFCGVCWCLRVPFTPLKGLGRACGWLAANTPNTHTHILLLCLIH